MFRIILSTHDSVPCLLPEGRLDGLNIPEFDRTLQRIASEQPVVVLDLSRCDYLASSALRSFLTTTKQLSAGGGALLLSGLQPSVQEVIEMTGLQAVLRIFRDTEEVLREARRLTDKSELPQMLELGEKRFRIDYNPHRSNLCLRWTDAGIASLAELEVAMGTGSPAGTLQEDRNQAGLFITLGNAAAFVPDQPGMPPDFRILRDRSEGGIFVNDALSFGPEPDMLLTPDQDLMMTAEELCSRLDELSETPATRLVVMLEHGNQKCSISGYLNKKGVVFSLTELPENQDYKNFQSYISQALTLLSVESVGPASWTSQAHNPVVWVFTADEREDAANRRIRVDYGGDPPEPWKLFLTRRLYSDSGRVVLKPLHGGYSAQTFQVESYDPEGRKLRPTVLKIGSRAMVARESDRCRQFALPYILNNSAQVLGTVFYADRGALRYNFVGIGGEETRLRWLTHLYNEWPAEKLEPVFDKIFLKILFPWYGQPVRTLIYPYRDHDPRTVFFKTLCETAEEVLGISSEQTEIEIPETTHAWKNPYRFLKYDFEERRNRGLEYNTSVCHGDLNMQNILLDQDMNVYLIDFSETRPRSVISDFARLEAIFLVEHAAIGTPEDRQRMSLLISQIYDRDKLDDFPEVTWSGGEAESMHRNLSLIRKMRQYALHYTGGDTDIRSYYPALLEWILPIVCYTGAPLPVMRLSAVAAASICARL